MAMNRWSFWRGYQETLVWSCWQTRTPYDAARQHGLQGMSW